MQDLLTYTVVDISGSKCRVLGRFINAEAAHCCQDILLMQNSDRSLVVDRQNRLSGISTVRCINKEARNFFNTQEIQLRVRCSDAVMPFVNHHIAQDWGKSYQEICRIFMESNNIPEEHKWYYLMLFQYCCTESRNEKKENRRWISLYDLTDDVPLELGQFDSEYIGTNMKKMLSEHYAGKRIVLVPSEESVLEHLEADIKFNDSKQVHANYNYMRDFLYKLYQTVPPVGQISKQLKFSREAGCRGVGYNDSCKLFAILDAIITYTQHMLNYMEVSGYQKINQPDIDIVTGKITSIDLGGYSQKVIGREKESDTAISDFWVLSHGWKPGIYLSKTEFNDAKKSYPHPRSARFYDWTEAEQWYNDNSLLLNVSGGYYVVRGQGIFKFEIEAAAAAKGSKKLKIRHFNTFAEACQWFKAINAMKKEQLVYYAVRKGNNTGVMFSYEEYQEAVEGCTDYESRIFMSYQEAKDWYDAAHKVIEQGSEMTEIGAQLAKLMGWAGKVTVASDDDKAKGKEKKSKKKVKTKQTVDVKEASAKPIVAQNPANKDDTVDDIGEEFKEAVVNEDYGKDNEISSKNSISKVNQEDGGQNLQNITGFRGIQFDKHLFNGMGSEEQKRFRHSFKDRLDRLERVMKGEVRAAGNSLKLIRKANGKAVLKRRVGKKRMSMYLQNGILTLMRLSDHDKQMDDIHRYKGKLAGYVYYELPEFIKQIDGYNQLLSSEENAANMCSFSEYISNPAHYVYDEDQQSVIEKGEQGENISIIGNAGAGKSIVGLEWLSTELCKENNDCIYLTMSPNLVYTLGYEFDKRKLSSDEKALSDIRIITTFDFIREHVHRLYPDIPEKAYMDSAQSLKAFTRFWQENVRWETFWEHEASSNYDDASTMLAVWRDLHGIIKGALPCNMEEIDYHKLNFMDEAVSEDVYLQLLRKEKKSDAKTRDVKWVTQLYQIYRRYKDYLKRQELIDDNDMAHMLLKAAWKGADLTNYGAAFIDECQDLTQVQLLALFMLLGKAKVKRLASDRCQMVQPTYFNEGTMRTMVNGYDASIGKNIELAGCRPQYLHYNYRSTKRVIEFQNYLVQSFTYNNILTLHTEEMMEICSPVMAPEGIRPVWITNNGHNKEQLINDLWKKMDRSDLQLIVSNAEGSSADVLKKDNSERITHTDVLSCKGMEYPSVLLYNVMSDMRFDQALGWKYFYVGATRSNNCLLIFEEDVENNPVLKEMLEDAAELELIDRCDDLYGIHAETGELWINYIRHALGENTSENRLATAESALNYGQYELALDIFQKLGVEQELITYCQGKVNEMYGEYGEAVRIFGTLPDMWSNKGRNRQNSVDQLMTAPDVDEVSYIGAYILSCRGRENLLVEAKAAYESKFGDSKGFYEAFGEAYLKYDFCSGELLSWRDRIAEQLDNSTANLTNSVNVEW